MARKKKAHAKENAERWLLTYADLITLLMVFFVLLFAMSTVDKKKYQELAGSLSKAFNVTVLQGQQPVAVTDSSSAAGPSVIEQQNFQQIMKAIQQFESAHNIPSNQISVKMNGEGIGITVSGVLLFYNGTNQIKPDGVLLLRQLGPILTGISNQIRVEGHTDDIPTDSATYPTNWELSAARAVSVTRYLIEQDSLQPTRLSAVGYGQFQPIVPDDTRDHREMNRRAVIQILYGQVTASGTSTAATPTAHP